MSDVAPVSTSVGISVLKTSEDLALSQIDQLLAPLSASASPASSDSASFSPAALAQLAQTESGMAVLH